MRWGWLVWDALAILAFTLIGIYFHQTPLSITRIGHTLIPFCIGWFGLALPLGLYRVQGARWWAFPIVLVLGVAIGVALRSWVFEGRGVALTTIALPFLYFSLLFIGLFTGLPRLIVALVRHFSHVRQVRQG